MQYHTLSEGGGGEQIAAVVPAEESVSDALISGLDSRLDVQIWFSGSLQDRRDKRADARKPADRETDGTKTGFKDFC